MSNYEKIYHGYDDEKLKKVISESYKYTEEALSAAKSEIQLRGIDIDAIPISQKEEVKNVNLDKIQSKVKEYLPSFEHTNHSNSFDIIDEDQLIIDENDRAVRLHKKLVGAFTIMCFYNIWSTYSLIWFMFTDSQAEWDFYTLFFVLPTFILPILTTLFYFRKKIAWIAIMFLFIEACTGNIYIAIMTAINLFNVSEYSYYSTETIVVMFFGIILLTSVNVYLVYLLTTKKIRINIFNVLEDQYFKIMFVCLVFSLLMVYALNSN